MAENEEKSAVPSNRRKILAVSVGLAVLAVLLLYIYTNQLANKYGVAGEKVSVIAAKYDLPPDKPITPDMLVQKEIPEAYVHPQAVFFNEWERIGGQRVSHPVRADQVLLWTDFADPRANIELDQVVKDGWRGMSINVDNADAMSGLLRPNDHVDILGTFMKPDSKEWVTLLQNVTVLAVGGQLGSQRASREESRTRIDTITVLVTPEEAELLTFAVDKGKIALTLRNENDITTELALPEKRYEDIFGEEKRNEIQTRRNDLITIIR